MKEIFTKHIERVVRPILPKDIDIILPDSVFYKLIRNYPEPSTIYKLVNSNKSVFYLKTGKNLQLECDKLLWLKDKLCVPEVITFSSIDNIDFLFITEVKGKTSDEQRWKSNISLLIDRLLETIDILKSVDITKCPFNIKLKNQIITAKTVVEKKLLKSTDLSLGYRNKSIEKHYERLMQLYPQNENIGFTHGDLCLPNILINNNSIGFVDLGSSGLGDTYRDLALISRSIQSNFGTKWENFFFSKLKGDIDFEKIEFYRLLDQFIMHRN